MEGSVLGDGARGKGDKLPGWGLWDGGCRVTVTGRLRDPGGEIQVGQTGTWVWGTRRDLWLGTWPILSILCSPAWLSPPAHTAGLRGLFHGHDLPVPWPPPSESFLAASLALKPVRAPAACPQTLALIEERSFLWW